MQKKHYRITLPHRGYGRSLGNMIQVLTGEASAQLEKEQWLMVERREPGVYAIVDDNLTAKSDNPNDQNALGICEWDEETEDLDAGHSDESQCFGMSDHLRWKDVTISLRHDNVIHAPSLKRLKQALHHVAFCAWCPYDI